MTTAVGSTNPTLADVIKTMDPAGGMPKMVEALLQQTPALEDATIKEGNLANGDLVITRTGLPSVGWRKFNEGVAAGKSRADQLTETCGMLEGVSNVDKKLAEFAGNGPAFRASEDQSFLTSMKNEIESSIFYSSSKTAPEKFMGLSPRLDLTTGPYGKQIINSEIASSGDNQTSVWLIVWHPETCYLMYPKGSASAGFKHTDMGLRMVTDANSREYAAYTSIFNWDIGLVVKDARYVARLANIDTSAIAKTGKLLIEGLIDLTERVESLEIGRPVLYMNRTVRTYLRQQALDTTKSGLTSFEDVGGKQVLHFSGIPVRRTDALLNTEAIVS